MKFKFVIFQSLEELYYFIMVMLYTLAVLFCADDLIGFGFNRLAVFFACALLVAILLLIKNHKREAITYYIMTGVVLFFLVILKVSGVSFEKFYQGTKDYLNSSQNRNYELDHFYAWVIAVLLFVMLYLVLFIFVRYRIWNIVFTALLSIISGVIFFSGSQILISTVTIILFLIVINTSEYLSVNRGKYYLLPFCAAAVLLPSLLPVKSEPVKWTFVKEVGQYTLNHIEKIMENWKILIGQEEYLFSIGEAGYSEDGMIQGTLDSSDIRTYMTVDADSLDTVYLKGSTYLYYTGNGWIRAGEEEQTDLDVIDHYDYDWMELQNSLTDAGLSEDELDELSRKHKLVIEYNDILTGSLFYPLKTFRFSGKNTESLIGHGANLAAGQLLGKQSKYELDFLEIDYEKLYSRLNRNQLTDESKAPQNHIINKYYTMLPKSVSDRTYDLAASVCEGAESDYEKICRIEEYLHRFQYSKRVDRESEEKDIVDYFLFESEKGYCTYFASAMVVLCRTQGIPARYVEGFFGVWDQSSKSKIEITGENAHAWCEVYIPQMGWVPFEPTPSVYQQTHQQDKSEYQNQGIIETPYHAEAVVDDLDQKEKLVTEAENSMKKVVRVLLIMTGTFLSLVLILLLLSYKMQSTKRRSHYEQMKPEERVILEFGLIKKLLLLLGHPVADNLTAEELIRFMTKMTDTCHDFKKLHFTFCEARYSNKQLEPGSEEIFRKIRVQLEEDFLNSASRIRRMKYYYNDKI